MEEGAAEKLVDNKPISSLFLISLRLLRRDWKGGELRLLFLALIMAVTSITGIALFTDRLEKALLLESANMLAADRIVSGRGDPATRGLNGGTDKRSLHGRSSVVHVNGIFRNGQYSCCGKGRN